MLRHTLAPALCAAALLAGCADGGVTEPSTIAQTVATVAPPSTTVAPTTSPPTTVADTTSSTIAPTVTLSADGPWTRVDSAPGVDTPGLFYELMPKLWVYLPIEEDLEHGITWTFNETDRPVIEAYLQAQLVYFQSATTGVIDDEWDRVFAASDGTKALLVELVNEGQHVELESGVVLRPTVLGEERSESTAIVFDCALDGSVFLKASGALAEGSTRGVLEIGAGSRLSLLDSGWMVTQTGRQPEACL